MICSITKGAKIDLLFIKSLNFRNWADLLYRDSVNVVCSHLIDSGLKIRLEEEYQDLYLFNICSVSVSISVLRIIS